MPMDGEDHFSEDASTYEGSMFSKVDYAQDAEIEGDTQFTIQSRLLTPFLWSKSVPPIPLDSDRKPFPIFTAGFVSRAFMFWLTPLLSVGYRRTITQQDMWTIPEEMTMDHMYPLFRKNLEEIVQSTLSNDERSDSKWPKHALTFAIWRTFKRELIVAGLFQVIGAVFTTLTPLLTKYLIQSVEDASHGATNAIHRGVGFAIGITLMILINSFITNHANLRLNMTAIRTSTVITKAILDQCLAADSETRHKFPGGSVLAFIGADLRRVETTISGAYGTLITFPPSFVIGVILLCINLRGPALVGIAVFILISAVTFPTTRAYGQYRRQINVLSDKRTGLIRQVLQSIKMIKLYAWEDAYEKKIKGVRRQEVAILYKMQTVIAILFSNVTATSGVTSMSAFLVSYAVYGMQSAAQLFSSLTLFAILGDSISRAAVVLPMAIDGVRSAARISDFLESPTDTAHWESYFDSEKLLSDDLALVIEDGTFFWNEFEDINAEEDKKGQKKKKTSPTKLKDMLKVSKTVLRGINLTIKTGEFVVITGLIGSGKSSLLAAMCGMIEKSSGKVSTNGSILFCGTPMVINATIKDNILFDEQFDIKKYNDVLDACALTSDLDLFQAGDLTEVGERGITLSGGQKARVSLARAVYNDRDIYLFDDVISAVDANVGKHIVDKCIMGYLSRKTRVLATHNLAVVQKADRVIFMNSDGSVDVGTEKELLKRNSQFASLMTHKNEVTEKPKDWSADFIDAVNGEESSHPTGMKKRKEGGGLVLEEERAINGIPLSTYWTYFTAGSGPFSMPFVILVTALSVFAGLFTNVWLSYWIEDKFRDMPNGTYIGIYVMFTLLEWIFSAVCLTLIGVVLARSGGLLSLTAIYKVLHTPMSFMEATPIGRVMNRFTKDTNTLDVELSNQLKRLNLLAAQVIGILILAVIYVPWFAISLPFFFGAFICLTNYFQATSREVKRLEALNRSYVMNNLNEVLNGVETIKAYGAQTRFTHKNSQLMDKMNEVAFVVYADQSWVNLALSLLATGVVLIITLLAATRAFSISASTAGLLTNYMIQFASLMSEILLFYVRVENSMNSVERTCHYAYDLVQEAPYTKNETKQPSSWPDKGNINFKNVSLRYRPNLPPVLRNLSMEVLPFEKIGICGRTGAGKSSLMTALFRIAELEHGSIEIDAVDISKLGLYELRSNLAIIPQDPVLFQGTIRSNLDPFEEKDDDALWEALRRGGLISDIEKMKSDSDVKSHKFHLDTIVEDEGSNFSLGERQLIALTRALVRRCKVLVMDEATSSVDYETDHLVQETIAREFKDCTILCIAHRLKTILKYDRVLVLEKGELEEFDKPYTLFTKGGRFREMCASAGITAANFA